MKVYGVPQISVSRQSSLTEHKIETSEETKHIVESDVSVPVSVSSFSSTPSGEANVTFDPPVQSVKLEVEEKTEVAKGLGEAKTSFMLHFEEKGNGADNEAVNESILESNDKAAKDTSSNSNESNSCNTNAPNKEIVEVNVKKEIKSEPGCDQESQKPLKNGPHEDTLLDKEKSKELSADIKPAQEIVKIHELIEMKEIKTEAIEEEIEEKSSSKVDELFVEHTEEALEDGSTQKQNVLLKQLLENCPSADSQGAAKQPLVVTQLSEEKEIKIEVQPNKQEEIVPVNMTDSIKVLETTSSVELSSKVDTNNNNNVNTNENFITSGSDTLMASSSLAEKKLSYLDIRRAQLEREPTPPPEEIKPKRKRTIKRKDSKSGSESGPVPKKRSRKSSSTRNDEDYEIYIKNLMTQLRTLDPLHVQEPVINQNYNVCSVFGSGDMNAVLSSLKGSYGQGFLPNKMDYYSVESLKSPTFNSGSKLILPEKTSTQKASTPNFYNQEFYKGTLLGTQFLNGSLSSFKDMIKCHRDSDSPESVLSASSGEIVLYDEPEYCFKVLKFLDEDKEEGLERQKEANDRGSPVIPLLRPTPIRPLSVSNFLVEKSDRKWSSESESEKNKENIIRRSSNGYRIKPNGVSGSGIGPLRDSGNVSVTLTLSSSDDVKDILFAISKLLGISTPPTYEIVERTTTPPSQKLGLFINKHAKGSSESDASVDNISNGKMKFCRFCEIVVMNAGFKKKSIDFPPSAREELEGDEITFCSTNCYMQFALSHGSNTTLEEKEAGSVVSHLGPTLISSQSTTSSINPSLDLLPPMSPMMEDDDVKENTNVSLSFSPKYLSLDKDTKVSATATLSTKNDISSNEEEKLILPRKRSTHQWHGIRYQPWRADLFESSRKQDRDKEKDIIPDDDNYDKPFQVKVLPNDERKCVLCHGIGDGQTDGSARLLNMDVDKWVHLNCALWSTEVYETVNGSLINVDLACKRGLTINCVRCHKLGASLKCFKLRCTNVYHFPCAISDGCMFFKDKTLFCSQHIPKIPNLDQEMNCFTVYRRVYVNRDEHQQMASMIHQGDQNLMRIGSLIFLNIGQLLPHQLQAFHTSNCIYPIGYKINRFYWSMRQSRKRCKYICSIIENDGHPQFVIEVEEEGYDKLISKGDTPKAVWQDIISKIVKMRQESNAIKIFSDYITGEDLFGLSEPSVVRILESLPGIESLNDYNFKFGRSQFLELPLAINPTGCARTEPKLRTHFKRVHTLHTRNAARSSLQSSFSGIEIQSPYIKQFVHSKSSQYRKMKTEWRNNVFLARSRIAGLGLYAARDIEKHTMVIEYIGQLIRNEIAERNERLYETQVSYFISITIINDLICL